MKLASKSHKSLVYTILDNGAYNLRDFSIEQKMQEWVAILLGKNVTKT
jgi:hypothetical protein